MHRQSLELAWDITDWERDADLSFSNIQYNLERTFLVEGLVFPASIICRPDQEKQLLRDFGMPTNDGTHIRTICLPYGAFKLKVLPLERVAITRAVR